MPSKISQAEFRAIVDDEIPLAKSTGYRIDRLESGLATIAFPFNAEFTRPGGTIAGPVQMMLADLCMYAAVLTLIGPITLAVTTNLNCNFLRRPKPAELIGEGRILKLGKRLAVGEVSLYSQDKTNLVAHATSTYSIPPQTQIDEDLTDLERLESRQ